jgi:hypothetical protein
MPTPLHSAEDGALIAPLDTLVSYIYFAADEASRGEPPRVKCTPRSQGSHRVRNVRPKGAVTLRFLKSGIGL